MEVQHINQAMLITHLQEHPDLNRDFADLESRRLPLPHVPILNGRRPHNRTRQSICVLSEVIPSILELMLVYMLYKHFSLISSQMK